MTITLNGQEIARCSDCGAYDGEDQYPEHTADGMPPLLIRLHDGLCQYCWDERAVARGDLWPCQVGWTGHLKGCPCG